MAGKAERHFVRFQRHGRPEDLAVVFDLTAAELLRVASHLASDLHEAEDLVQSAFLAAIEHRSQCERRSGVLAWLLGILVNLAREQRRRSARRPDPERVPQARGMDASQAAEAQEVTRAVSEAIARLPDVYRPVLNLHLRHGLSAAEIALSLERPPATVRSQLSRGTELLRRALPRGLAVGAALAAAPVRGLAAVRAVVLGRVGSTAAGVAVAAGGGLLMKKLLVVGFGAVGAFVWWGLGSGGSPVSGQPPVQLPGTSSLVGAQRMEEDAGVGTPVAAEQADSPERVPVAPTDGEAELAVIRGRCVAAESGSPLAGCTVRLVGYDRLANAGDSTRWTDPEPIVTGTDGIFAFEFEALEDVTIHVRFEVVGRMPTSSDVWGTLRNGVVVNLEDVPLLAGPRVLLRVTEQDGQPVEGLKFVLRHQDGPLPLHPDMGNNDAAYGMSGEDGLLRQRSPLRPELVLRPGWWQVMVSGTEDVIEPRWVEVPAHESLVEVTLVRVRPSPEDTISGRVVLDTGLPVEGLEIRAYRSGAVGYLPAVTDADGHFYFSRLRRDSATYRLELDRRDLTYQFLEPQENVPLGTADLELVVRRIPAFGMKLEVVAAETDEPVEEFGYRVYLDPDHYGQVRGWAEVERGEHPGGMATVEGLREGHHRLSVFPAGDDLVPTRGIPLEVGSAPPLPMTVKLHAPVTLVVDIVRADGDPTAGSRVELVRYSGEDPLDLRTYVEEVRELGDLSTNSFAALRGSGVTDSRGRVTFSASPAEDLALRVLGPGHLPRIVDRVHPRPGSDPLEVIVDEGATVTGRLSPAELVRYYGDVADEPLQSVDRERRYPMVSLALMDGTLPPTPITCVVRQDGSFGFDDVPPGSFALRLDLKVPEASVSKRVEIGQILDLSAGERRNLECGLDDLVPGRISGLLLYGGEQHARGELFFMSLDSFSMMARGTVTVRADAEGKFRGIQLPPGRYLPGVILPAEGVRGLQPRTVGTQVIEVLPGAATDLVIRIPRHVYRIRLLDRDGTPAARRRVHLRPLAHDLSANFFRPQVTDQDGRIVFDPAPPFPSEVLVYEGDEPIVIGNVLMPAGSTEGEWEFRLER